VGGTGTLLCNKEAERPADCWGGRQPVNARTYTLCIISHKEYTRKHDLSTWGLQDSLCKVNQQNKVCRVAYDSSRNSLALAIAWVRLVTSNLP